MRRPQLPPLLPTRRREELEDLLAAEREQAPDEKSIEVLIEALQKTLDRQYTALESADRKAAVLLGAILGVGFLNSDKLRAPAVPALVPFAVAILASLAAVFASLWVLWSRTLLTGPNPVRAAQATSWSGVPFSQSVADALAVASQENAEVNLVKGIWLNIAFTAATIAVISLAALGLLEGVLVKDDKGITPSGPAVAASPMPAATSEWPSAQPTDEPPATQDGQPTPTTGGFVHPRLGVAELREGWDPRAVPEPQPPPPAGGDGHG